MNSVLKVNGSAALATTYDYDLRSWLTKVTSQAFEEELHYNENDGTVKPIYGGNVSAMEWKTAHDARSRQYGFAYDGLGRLTAATYGEKDASGKQQGKASGKARPAATTTRDTLMTTWATSCRSAGKDCMTTGHMTRRTTSATRIVATKS